MKVICINDKPLFGSPHCKWLIREQQVYVVIAEYNRHGGVYYELDIQPGVGYTCENFIPLSEIDETVGIKTKSFAT